ncbi:MAG: hypothetical protein HYY29_03555 [Chloroflexi bacterium]|nr:hypothetical protein [Chloroflexota bacterium]
MTLTAVYLIRCDICGAIDPYDTAGLRLDQIRAAVRGRGWHRGRARTSGCERTDICPACWAKREEK